MASSTDRDRVRAYYTASREREWARLEQPEEGAIELARTTEALERHLPAGSRVLDIGGGPGRYAIWLAERGHTVSLGDLSPDLLAVARERVSAAGVGGAVAEIVEADACDLSRWGDGSFDAALCLGPFYHLVAPGDRDRAARELARVVRPGGLVFAAFIPRYVFAQRELIVPEERHHLLDPAWVRRLVEDGVFENDVPGRFDSGYGARSEEIDPFFAERGFDRIELLPIMGRRSDVEDVLAALAAEGDPALEIGLRLIADTGGDPAQLGAMNHLLYVGRRL